MSFSAADTDNDNNTIRYDTIRKTSLT